MDAIIFDWGNTLAARRELYPYSAKVIEELAARYRLGLISIPMRSPQDQLAQIADSGLMGYFASVHVPADKSAEDFLACMTALGSTPARTAVVGDNPTKEIAIGNQLGCATYLVNTKRNADELVVCTARIGSVEDLLAIF